MYRLYAVVDQQEPTVEPPHQYGIPRFARCVQIFKFQLMFACINETMNTFSKGYRYELAFSNLVVGSI